MDPAMLAAYVQAVSQAGLPKRVLVEAMQAGGILPENEDPAELEAEMEANAQAQADAEANAARDALQMQMDAKMKMGGKAA
jgi:hypothetical protein